MCPSSFCPLLTSSWSYPRYERVWNHRTSLSFVWPKEYEIVEKVCPLYDHWQHASLLTSSYCGSKCENIDRLWILLSCRSYIWPAIEGFFPHDDFAHVLQFIQTTFCMCSTIYSSYVSCGLVSFPDSPLTFYCHCKFTCRSSIGISIVLHISC